METAVVLSRRPELDRRALARRLPPVWLDFRPRLRESGWRIQEIDRRAKALGYSSWPAVPRAETGERVMALRERSPSTLF